VSEAVESLTLIERIKRGNDILWGIWLEAVKVADNKEKWLKVTDPLDRGIKKLQGFAHQARLEGYNECCFGNEKYKCLEQEKICFACTFHPPEKCPNCGNPLFWFAHGEWLCSTCHPKLASTTYL
jgi:hypothetical protein